MYVTNPAHGGKVTCHECGSFIEDGNEFEYYDPNNFDEFPTAYFHTLCYNVYEHYYGLDKPID